MFNKPNAASRKRRQAGSEETAVVKIMVAIGLLILTMLGLHLLNKQYNSIDGAVWVSGFARYGFYGFLVVLVAALLLPRFWKSSMAGVVGRYAAGFAALLAFSCLCIRFLWLGWYPVLCFVHVAAYCLYILYMLYKTEFFLVSLATVLAGGVFFSYSQDSSASLNNVLLGVVLALVLASEAVLANLAAKGSGFVTLGKQKFHLFPAKFSPLALYVTCAVWLVCFIACLIFGSLFAYYCMFAAIAYELIAAVYFTFQLK